MIDNNKNYIYLHVLLVVIYILFSLKLIDKRIINRNKFIYNSIIIIFILFFILQNAEVDLQTYIFYLYVIITTLLTFLLIHLIKFNYISNKFYKIFIFMIYIAFLIFSYGFIRCKTNLHDPFMNKLKIGNKKLFDLDFWSILHFLCFTIITYLLPHKFLTIQLFGISWELFEQLLGKHRPDFLGGFGNCENLLQTDKNTELWWYGRASDIIMNFFGGLFGYYLSKL